MKKMNNKGFSLVELIIVIAIMAILIAVLAPQYIKYVEKSRRSADLDNYQAIIDAVQVVYSDEENTISGGATITASKGSAINITGNSALTNALSDLGVDPSKLTTKSSLYGTATFTVNETSGIITISMTSGSPSLKTALGLK